MAYINTSNPNNAPGAVTGAVNAGNVNSQYVFGNIQKPDFSDYITYRFPQYTITTLLNRIGRKSPVVGNDVFSWFEKGKFRNPFTVTGTVTGGNTSAITFNVAASASGTPLLTGDVLRFEGGDLAVVTSSTMLSTTGSGVIGAFTIDGVAPSVTVAANQRFSHVFNIQEEYSNSPSGRVWQETQVNEYLAIMRRSVTCSTTQGSNMKYVKKSDSEWSYYYINEMETMQEMAMDREMYILTSKASSTATTGNVFPSGGTQRLAGNGIIPKITAGGVVGTYSSAIAESDLAEQIRLMCLNSSGNEFTVLCGSQAFADAQFALRDYTLNGGISFGTFSGAGIMTGINITQYKFMDKILNFVLYYPFANQALFPTPVSSGINWDKAMLFLNMGTDDRGNPLINLRYKQDLLGQSLEFRRTVQSGITSPESGTGVERSNGKDGFTVDFYSSIGVELRAANNHGLLYAA
jgi:hypothetical protein